MQYPRFIKQGDIIGVTAPASGCNNEVDIKKLEYAKQNFLSRGFHIKETDDVKTDINGRSAKPKQQAEELEELINNDEIAMILCFAGGDFLLEMLSYFDYTTMKKNPKWIQGFSDPTGLLFTITTNLDIATIYGGNLKAFSMIPWHSSLENNLEILKGNLIEQHNFRRYQRYYMDSVTGCEPYTLDAKVKWDVLLKPNTPIEGRLIGGCIDVLLNLVGTRFDKTTQFVEKYKEDGIVWYFDNAELSYESLIRGLWQLKEAGWFQNVKGFLFGRSAQHKCYYDITFEEAILRILEEYQVPIVIEMDFGHVVPRMALINGAYVKVTTEKDGGKVELELKP